MARKCQEIVKKWSKMVRKLVQDGQEMVQVVGILSEIFRKCSETARYAQEKVQDGQEMVEKCEDGLKWSEIFWNGPRFR